MELNNFICCQENPQFEKVKEGYRCMNCGKIYLSSSIEYEGKTITFGKIKYQTKIRGRKADYLKNINTFSTLETGKVNIMHMDNQYDIVSTKSIKVKKNVLEHKLNFYSKCLTISEKGIIDIYDIESEEIIGQYKTGREYNHYKLKIFPLGQEGKWLYIDTEKILSCSSEFNNRKTILQFRDVFGNDILSIKSVDYNLTYDSFAIHVNYITEKEDGKHNIMQSSFVLKYKNGNFDVEHIVNKDGYKLSYEFKTGIFYGIDCNKLISVNQDIGELYNLPIVRCYSDGEGIFFVEEFIRFPEKSYFLTDNVIVLLYMQEIIILDIKKRKIIDSFDGGYNLIQSFFIIDINTICFSAGLNTYIYNVLY